MLDLPGGGRENDESGAECVARETQEEFGIQVAAEKFEYIENYPNWRGQGAAALFFICHLPRSMLGEIIFGDEGQGWETMAASDFIARSDAVPHLQKRVGDYLNR